MLLSDPHSNLRTGLALVAFALAGAASGQAQFFSIASPDGGYLESAALSANGQYAAGYYDTPLGNSGFRWSVAGGFEDLGRPAGTETFRNAYIKGISGDGSKVVGWGRNGSTAETYVWQQGVGVSAPSLPYPTIQSVSADGSTYVGFGEGAVPGSVRSWRTVNGVSTDLGLLPGSIWTAAYAMSDDGTVVAGYSAFPGSPVNSAAPFIWREGEGLSAIPLPSGTVNAIGQSVSRDGKIVVGTASSVADSEVPFAWSALGGSQALDESLFPFGRTYVDYATNGGMIFGKNDTSGPYSAVVWESATSSQQDLKTWLIANYGLGSSLAGWNLEEILSASPDGRTLVGNGQFNGQDRSFLIQLTPVPEPAGFAILAGGLGLLARRRRRK